MRAAVPDTERAADALRRSSAQASPIPVVADIHFDYRLALAGGEARRGQDPHQPRQHRRRRTACKAVAEGLPGARNIPIRIGVNAGSVEKAYSSRSTARPTPGGAWSRARGITSTLLNKYDFDDIVPLAQVLVRAADASRPTGIAA